MKKFTVTKVSLSVAVVLGLLSACKGGDDPKPENAPTPVSTQAELFGSVTKGTMIGGRISVASIVGGEASTTDALTDSNGEVFLTLNSAPGYAFNGIYRVEAIADDNATMVCDTSACGIAGLGENIDSQALLGTKLTTLSWVSSPLGTQEDGEPEATFQATVLTTLATALLEQAISEGRNISALATLEPAQAEFSVMLMRILGYDTSNFDVFSTPVVSVESVESVAGLDAKSLNASLINASFAFMPEDITLSEHLNTMTALVLQAAAGDAEAIAEIRAQLLTALTAHPVIIALGLDPESIINVDLPVIVESQGGGPLIEYTTEENLASADITWRAAISDGESGDKALDKDNQTKWLDNASIPSVEDPSWIAIAFENAVPVNTLSLTSANDAPERDPENLTLEASLDGETWVTLAEWAGVSFDERFETQHLSFNNSLAYRHYRLNITKNKGDSNLMQVAEIGLSGPIEPAIVHSSNATSIEGRGFIGDAEAPEMAFDSNINTKWLDDTGVPTEDDPSWVDVGFANPVNINVLAITSANDAPSRDPENFSVLGSNDGGETWNEVATWVGETFDSRFERKWLSFQNPKSYSLYRINISKNSGDDSLMQVAELSLIGPDQAPINHATSEGVVVDVRGAISEGEAGEFAFDGDDSTKWLDDTGIPSVENPSFATVTLPAPKAVNTFTITSANDAPSRDPENVTLLASHDGETWVSLGSWAGISFEQRAETQIFSLSNMQAFTYYQINITKNKGDDSLMQVAELGLYGTDYAAIDHTDSVDKVVTARAAISDAEAGEMAFDNTTATKWLDNGGIPSEEQPSWVEVALSSSAVVNQFTITSANDAPSRDPENFSLLGSNDGGTTWSEVGSWAGETFDNRLERKLFTTSNGRAFNLYRINITKNKGDDSLMQVAEFELLGPQL